MNFNLPIQSTNNILSFDDILSLIVLFLGLVSYYFKPFIKSQYNLEKDIKLLLSKCKEKVCTAYSLILEKAVLEGSLDKDITSSLRGSPPNKPDLIGNYVNVLFNNVEYVSLLKIYLKKVRLIYNILFYSSMVALVVFIYNLIIRNTSLKESIADIGEYNLTLLLMSCLCIGQIVSIICIRYLGNRVMYFEERNN